MEDDLKQRTVDLLKESVKTSMRIKAEICDFKCGICPLHVLVYSGNMYICDALSEVFMELSPIDYKREVLD